MQKDLEAISSQIEHAAEAADHGNWNMANIRVLMAQAAALVALCDRLDRTSVDLTTAEDRSIMALTVVDSHSL